MGNRPLTLEEVPGLLDEAFAAARRSGKPSWRRMSTAVLKNRLLHLTGGRFDEGAMGFSSLPALLEQFNDLVGIDHSTKPATIEYKPGAEKDDRDGQEAVRTRLRPDLWRAVFDYSTDEDWVWDERARCAVRVADRGEMPVLPTVTRDEFAAIRRSFVQECMESDNPDAHEQSRLERWSNSIVGTTFLPRRFRGKWNAHLKAVASDRLTTWFSDRHLEIPMDLLQPIPGERSIEEDADLARLRNFIIECVRNMTLDELRHLNLPADAVFRATIRPKGTYDRT